jgi:hypothetical protein
MSVIIKTEVATCPYCKNADAVLVQENDLIYACSCGSSFVKWWAEEKGLKIEQKTINLDEQIEILGERCGSIFTTTELDKEILIDKAEEIVQDRADSVLLEELQAEEAAEKVNLGE